MLDTLLDSTLNVCVLVLIWVQARRLFPVGLEVAVRCDTEKTVCETIVARKKPTRGDHQVPPRCQTGREAAGKSDPLAPWHATTCSSGKSPIPELNVRWCGSGEVVRFPSIPIIQENNR